MGFFDPKRGANSTFGAGGALPNGGLLPGDELWIFLVSNGNPTTAFTAPAGWSAIGSESNWTTGRAAIYKHTYANGDSYPAFTHPSSFNAIIFVVRATGSYSTVTDTTTTGTTDGSGNGTLNKFSPSDAAHDLRLLFLAVGGSASWTSSVVPTPAISADNPTQLPLETSNIPGLSVASNVLAGAAVYRGFWADPSTGLDGTNGTVAFGASLASKNYYSRSICLTDGSGSSGPDSSVEGAYITDPHITAEALQAAPGDGLDAAKGHYVGRTRIL
jgi:hypothetical protein